MMPAMDTIEVGDFKRYCGPVALADVLGITCETAARLLLGIQRNRGLVTAPGTDEIDLVLCLDMYGAGAERFDPSTGVRLETAAECIERARLTPPHTMYSQAEIHTAVQAVIDASPAAEQSRLSEYFRRRHDGKPLLGEWMDRMDGVWLICVENDCWGHWIALDDHAIDVRDAEYRNCPTTWALRVIREHT